MTRPRVLLADDHRVVAEGLRGLLGSCFEVVGIVSDGIETGLIPGPLASGVATLLGTTPEHHLTIALLSVGAPAAVVAAILYLVAVPQHPPVTVKA